MVGLSLASSMVQSHKKARKASRKSTIIAKKAVLPHDKNRQGNPAMLEFYGNIFKDVFAGAKKEGGKAESMTIDPLSPKENVMANLVDEKEEQLAAAQASQVSLDGGQSSANKIVEVPQEIVNPEISFVNINSNSAETDVPQSKISQTIADREGGVIHSEIVSANSGDLDQPFRRELIDTIATLTRKVDALSNATREEAKTTHHVDSQPESLANRSPRQSPTNSASPESPASPATSVESREGTKMSGSVMDGGKGTANKDQASARIDFLESEVAIYEQVVASKENDILGIEEDHQAIVDDLHEQLAAAEDRIASSEAELKKEQASKKKTMTKRNEVANLNKQLREQISTGQPGESPLVKTQRETIEHLRTVIKGKDEELATATASLKKEACDGGFWHGAYILTMTELENANPDAAMRYNGIVRRKDEKISELEEDLEHAREAAREADAGREDDRIKQSGKLTGYRKWAVEFQRSLGIIPEIYERLQDQISNVARTLASKMPHDEATEALQDTCKRISIENDKLFLAANNFDHQVIAQNEANADSQAKIAGLEAALELEEQKHELTRSEPRELRRKLDEMDGSWEIKVDDLTDEVEQLEKALDKQTKVKDSLERDAVAGTLAQTVIHGLNNQIHGLKQEITQLQDEIKKWAAAYAHQNGALLEARGVGSDGEDLDIGVSGIHIREIRDFQVETLRRRVKIAEAPLLAVIGKFRDRIERKGGILAGWGLQYEVDEVDVE